MKLSIVIPCYNELNTIGPLVQAVKGASTSQRRSSSLTIAPRMAREIC